MGYFDKSTLPFYYGLAEPILDRRPLLRIGVDADVPEPHVPARGHVVRTHSQRPSRRRVVGSRRASSTCSTRRSPRSRGRSTSRRSQVEELFSYVLKHQSHIAPIKQYYADAKAGKLPQVSFVEADPFGDVNHESDEHPPANVQIGQKFTHDVMKALVNEPELVVVGAVPHLRRARRLLRPRRAARRAEARQHPADAQARRHPRRLRPLRDPGADDRRLALREEALRLAHGLRPHVDPALHRDLPVLPAVIFGAVVLRRRRVKLLPLVALCVTASIPGRHSPTASRAFAPVPRSRSAARGSRGRRGTPPAVARLAGELSGRGGTSRGGPSGGARPPRRPSAPRARRPRRATASSIRTRRAPRRCDPRSARRRPAPR